MIWEPLSFSFVMFVLHFKIAIHAALQHLSHRQEYACLLRAHTFAGLHEFTQSKFSGHTDVIVCTRAVLC